MNVFDSVAFPRFIDHFHLCPLPPPHQPPPALPSHPTSPAFSFNSLPACFLRRPAKPPYRSFNKLITGQPFTTPPSFPAFHPPLTAPFTDPAHRPTPNQSTYRSVIRGLSA